MHHHRAHLLYVVVRGGPNTKYGGPVNAPIAFPTSVVAISTRYIIAVLSRYTLYELQRNPTIVVAACNYEYD